MIGTLTVQQYSSTEQAVRDVLSFGGPFSRNTSDQRVVADFLACRGATQVGGWSALEAGTPNADAGGGRGRGRAHRQLRPSGDLKR